MRGWRAAAAMIALLAAAGCGADAAGTATLNPAAAIPSPGIPGPPSGADPAGSAPASPAPAVTTLTVTTVTTAPPPAASPPSATRPASSQPMSTATATPPTDLAGEVHAFITAVDVPGGTLTVDKIDWFTGAAAQQACAEDGVTDTSNNRCTGWYFRNRNPALRQVPVAPDATITVLAGGVRGVPGDLATVGREASRSPWRLTVTDGRVTDLEEIYLP